MNFRKELTENILPFWLENAVDYENGGIYTSLDKKGKIYGEEKRHITLYQMIRNICGRQRIYMSFYPNVRMTTAECSSP